MHHLSLSLPLSEKIPREKTEAKNRPTKLYLNEKFRVVNNMSEVDLAKIVSTIYELQSTPTQIQEWASQLYKELNDPPDHLLHRQSLRAALDDVLRTFKLEDRVTDNQLDDIYKRHGKRITDGLTKDELYITLKEMLQDIRVACEQDMNKCKLF
jgi:hypothetical protein